MMMTSDEAATIIQDTLVHFDALAKKYPKSDMVMQLKPSMLEAVRVLLEGYKAAVNEINAQGACITCIHHPYNGGTCPGFIDCHNPDSPLAEFYRQKWRGICSDNQSGPMPGGEVVK